MVQFHETLGFINLISCPFHHVVNHQEQMFSKVCLLRLISTMQFILEVKLEMQSILERRIFDISNRVHFSPLTGGLQRNAYISACSIWFLN
jgi:hypothetical protein